LSVYTLSLAVLVFRNVQVYSLSIFVRQCKHDLAAACLFATVCAAL